jgi:hypothetical protein
MFQRPRSRSRGVRRDRACEGGATYRTPEPLESLAGCLVPALDRAVENHGIDSASTCSADTLDPDPRVGKQIVEDAPGECAMSTPALQGQLNRLLSALCRHRDVR